MESNLSPTDIMASTCHPCRLISRAINEELVSTVRPLINSLPIVRMQIFIKHLYNLKLTSVYRHKFRRQHHQSQRPIRPVIAAGSGWEKASKYQISGKEQRQRKDAI